MKFVFFGDLFKGICRFLLLALIILLVIPKLIFSITSPVELEKNVNMVYEVSVEEKKEKEYSSFTKIWLDIKEFYLYGF